MSVLWSDLQSQTNDYIRNYTTGNINAGQQDRAQNRAIEYFQRRLSLPSDRRIYKFYFYSNQLYYNLPVGFNEAIGLYYDTQTSNTPDKNWDYRPDLDILGFSGLQLFSNRYFGFSTINQSLQLILLGPNINQPQILDPLSTIGNWVASSDASALAVDSNIFKFAPASLSFTITPSAGTGILKNSFAAGNALNFLTYTQNNAQFSFWVYFATANFTNIKFRFGSDTSNYTEGTATVDINNTAFTANSWQQIAFNYNNMTIVGSPNYSQISFYQITFTEGAGFTTAGMRVNQLKVTMPDYMDLVFYSSYKGYVSGSSPKTDILNFISPTNSNDILYFGDFAPDLIGPIAKKSAIELMPAMRQDKDFYGAYKEEVKELMKTYGRIYPRKRLTNYGRTIINRSSLN